jgi:hypothetical protein
LELEVGVFVALPVDEVDAEVAGVAFAAADEEEEDEVNAATGTETAPPVEDNVRVTAGETVEPLPRPPVFLPLLLLGTEADTDGTETDTGVALLFAGVTGTLAAAEEAEDFLEDPVLF